MVATALAEHVRGLSLDCSALYLAPSQSQKAHFSGSEEMESPAYRLDLVNGQTGEALKRIPLDYAMSDNIFGEWPIDADVRAVIPTPNGYPLEIRLRRIL